MTKNTESEGAKKEGRQMKPSLEPQHINPLVWYYEYPTHIILVYEIREPITRRYVRSDQIKIPWRKLEASLERCRSARVKNKRGVRVSQRKK